MKSFYNNIVVSASLNSVRYFEGNPGRYMDIAAITQGTLYIYSIAFK